MNPLLVIADTIAQADHYARTHGLAPDGWRFVREVDQVRGMTGGRFVVLAHPKTRPSAIGLAKRGDVILYLKTHGFARVD